ncbi:MAG: DUF1223 domain-containing protein [Paracoccus sp. (in: a-proteobacteria)]
MSASRRTFSAGRAGYAGLIPALAAAALLGGAAAGQAQEGGPGGAGNDLSAPVISAPDDPGRAAPGALSRDDFLSGGGFNSFAASEAPPMDSFLPPSLPVVVELFTAQGCSTCPPADAMLEKMAAMPGVLPLSFNVDYWDYLGWTDSFASPDFTRRQEGYARASGEHALYTPQIIVDGRDTAVAPGPAQLMAMIDENRISPAMLSVQRESGDDGERIELTPLSDLGGPVVVVLVRYAPNRAVEVTAGENSGRVVSYTNVVLSISKLAKWDGTAPLRLNVRPDESGPQDFPPDTRHVLLVQRGIGPDELPGPILAAIKLD